LRHGESAQGECPFVFTYHHNDPLAYAPLVVAVLDTGLTCTATLPVPGEMSASLHVAGTKSSILDSVFVCRTPGAVDQDQTTVGARLERDVTELARVPYKPTPGDIACLTAGHVAGAAIQQLRATWNPSIDLAERIDLATAEILRIQEASS